MAKILVIDDELDICLMLSKHLQNLQFETQYATSIKEAQYNISRYQYDAMFVDLNLLDGSGYDVIHDANNLMLATKIVVISAHDGEASASLERGADFFIAKPFTTKRINEALINLNLLQA